MSLFFLAVNFYIMKYSMQIMNIQLQLLLHQKDTLELLKVRNLCSIALSSNLF